MIIIMRILITLSVFFYLESGMAQQLCTYPSLKNPYRIITIDSLLESTPIGTSIATFDIVGNQSQITLSFYPGSENLFAFDATTKSLILVKALEVTGENSNKFISDLYLNCSVTNSMSTSKYSITINVNDTNNHSPIFRNTPYSKILDDNTAVGTNVFIVNVTDDDPSDRGMITYYVADNSYSKYFAFKPNNDPSLSLLQPLKFEDNITFEILIFVKDNSYSFNTVSHITNTTVVFTVYQSPDDNPVFSKSIYFNYVRDYVAVPGRELIFNPPIEPMKTDNFSLEFKIIQNTIIDDWQYFNLDSLMHVFISKALIKELYIFEIQVSKTRNKNRYGKATILVHVLKDILLTLNVDIFAPINYIIYDFTKIIQDIKSAAFEHQNLDSMEYFTLSGNQLMTKKYLTDIKNPNLNLSVLLNDYFKNASQRIILNINVICQPSFVQKFFSFTSNSKNNIGQLKMLNAQNVSTLLRYEIIQKLNIFIINSDGWISSVQDLDMGTSYSFIVNCECASGPKDTALVTISTTGSNSNFQIATIVLGILSGFFLLCCFILLAMLVCCFCRSRNSNEEKSKFKHSVDQQSSTYAKNNFAFDDYKIKESRNSRPSNEANIHFVEGAISDSSQSDVYRQNHYSKESKPTSYGRVKVGEKGTFAKRKPDREVIFNPNVISSSSQSLVENPVDYTSSMDTISASNTTLTRPPVGTNGITVYY